ncbi:unnamed protein product [Discula destructiva]
MSLSTPTSTVISVVDSPTPGVNPDSTPGVIDGSTPGVVTSSTSESSIPAGFIRTVTTTVTETLSGISTALSTLGPLLGTASSLKPSPSTAPSVITLSEGLGPLLSSSTSTSSSATSSDSPAPADTGSTSIGVISDILEPTGSYSDLTTAGIPESLSVNLSLATGISALDSPNALISFGTSSPAVLSTVLPPGSSMGTSSQTITTLSTIALNSASLTGVTLLAPRSPTSCFTIPTPAASLDLIAVAVVPQDDYDVSNPILLAFGDNGTTPQYISAMASGNPYILNLSPDNDVVGQLGLEIPGGDALVFDGSGMSLYTGHCSTVTQVLVADFFAQLGSLAGRPSRGPTPSGHGKRQSVGSGPFTVEVAVDSYLSTASFSPNLTFGDSQCTLQLNEKGPDTINITWFCTYPPPTGGEASCQSNIDSWFNDMTAPSTKPGNTTEVLATISPFLGLAGDSILDLFPGSDPALALGFTFMRQAEKAARRAVGYVGPAACAVMHAFDSDDLVVKDSGPLGTQTLGSYMTAPPPSIAINLAASATAAIVNIPRRKVNPKDNFLTQIATDFKSLLGAFTHWLGGWGFGHQSTSTAVPGLGVPGLGGIGGGTGLLEEAGSLPLANPDVTITSTPTLATPSVVHVDMRTMTVTHVLGNGWFTPSTYSVGPEANTLPQSIAKDPSEAETNASFIDTASKFLDEYDFLSSSSFPPHVAPSSVDYVVAQIAPTEMSNSGAQNEYLGSLRSPSPETGTGTITTGIFLGYEGHVVVVTTTVTFLNSDMSE